MKPSRAALLLGVVEVSRQLGGLSKRMQTLSITGVCLCACVCVHDSVWARANLPLVLLKLAVVSVNVNVESV